MPFLVDLSHQSTRLPPAAGDIYRFQVANAVCWSFILGFPTVLFLQSQGASATVLGLGMGMAPLLTILQIPSAGWVEMVGYRKFVFVGWAARAIFAFGMTAVAWWGVQRSGDPRVVGWFLAMLATFCFIRGISSAGVLPWFTQLIPERVRGRYLSLEQVFILSTTTVVALMASLIFLLWPGPEGFVVVFLVGSLFGVFCLFYLWRIPEVEVPDERRKPRPMPWSIVLGHLNFRRILCFNQVVILAWTGGGIVIVTLWRDGFGLGSDSFMLLHASAFGASILGLLTLSRFFDRSGSRPLLQLSVGMMVVHFFLWTLIAMGWIPLTLWALVLTQGSWGVVHSLYTTSNIRLVMQVIPEEHRSHFFAVFSVAQAFGTGVYPILWGLLLDLLRASDPGTLFNLSPYAIAYGLVVLVAALSFLALRPIKEEGTMPLQEVLNELMVRTPGRLLSRIIVRRPIFK